MILGRSEIRKFGPKVRLGYKPQRLTPSPCLGPHGSRTPPTAPPSGRPTFEHAPRAKAEGISFEPLIPRGRTDVPV